MRCNLAALTSCEDLHNYMCQCHFDEIAIVIEIWLNFSVENLSPEFEKIMFDSRPR